MLSLLLLAARNCTSTNERVSYAMQEVIRLPCHLCVCAVQVTHLHAFYIKYSPEPGVGQVSLGRHRDDSTFTINLCLSSGLGPDALE